jgi:hypothetical protein
MKRIWLQQVGVSPPMFKLQKTTSSVAQKSNCDVCYQRQGYCRCRSSVKCSGSCTSTLLDQFIFLTQDRRHLLSQLLGSIANRFGIRLQYPNYDAISKAALRAQVGSLDQTMRLRRSTRLPERLSTRKITPQILPGTSRSAVPQLCPSARLLQSPKGKPSKSTGDFKGLLVAGACSHQDLRLRVCHGAEAANFALLVLKIQVMAKVSDQLEKMLLRAAAQCLYAPVTLAEAEGEACN